MKRREFQDMLMGMASAVAGVMAIPVMLRLPEWLWIPFIVTVVIGTGFAISRVIRRKNAPAVVAPKVRQNVPAGSGDHRMLGMLLAAVGAICAMTGVATLVILESSPARTNLLVVLGFVAVAGLAMATLALTSRKAG